MKVERVGYFCDHTSGVGGGEHHAFSIALALGRRWPVDLFVRAERFLPDPVLFRRGFGLDLSGANVRPQVLQSPLDVGRYDLFVNLSHFTVLPPAARRNILAIFFPQMQTEWARDYDAVLSISRYSTEWTRKYWGVSHVVHAYPPVDADRFGPAVKEPIILSVGRFFEVPDGNNKNHALMIRAFKALRARGATPWRLVLAGSSSEDHRPYLERVRAEASGEPIDIVTDPPFEVLRDLYARAAVYWHAAGFDREGLTIVPSAAEHFGLTVIEAMASGCVPVVADAGGPAEIVIEPENGVRCATLEQMVEKTLWLIEHEADRRRLASRARERSRDFGRDRFDARFDAIVDMVLEDDPEPKARFYLGEGNHAEAERLFADAVDGYPTDPAPYAGLAECFYRTGRRELATAMWMRAIDVAPQAAGAAALRARIARVRQQRAAVQRVRSGELFGETYFERGSAAGINAYSEYDGAPWAGTQASIVAAAFAPATCLDIGCAKGDFVRQMRARSVQAFGTDLSVYSVSAAAPDVRSSLCASSIAALPFADSAFDLVVCIEVLEHLPPELVDAALEELWRVGRQFVYATVQNTTAADPDHFFADLTHLTMKPLAWWQQQFRRHRFEIIPLELPFSEFQGHQIVAQPLGKFDGWSDGDIDMRVAHLLDEAVARRQEGAPDAAVRSVERAINLLDLLEHERRRRPEARRACYRGLADAYRAMGLHDRAAVADRHAAAELT